jgi:hypothetical protein
MENDASLEQHVVTAVTVPMSPSHSHSHKGHPHHHSHHTSLSNSAATLKQHERGISTPQSEPMQSPTAMGSINSRDSMGSMGSAATALKLPEIVQTKEDSSSKSSSSSSSDDDDEDDEAGEDADSETDAEDEEEEEEVSITFHFSSDLTFFLMCYVLTFVRSFSRGRPRFVLEWKRSPDIKTNNRSVRTIWTLIAIGL